MVKIKQNELTWDYLGWKKHYTFPSETHQRDWNNTLITQINQASAQIHMSSTGTEEEGPATFVIAHISLKYLINTMEYYNKDERTLGSRYIVIFSTDLEEDTMRVGNEYNEILITIING
jgi:hypothetical protein